MASPSAGFIGAFSYFGHGSYISADGSRLYCGSLWGNTACIVVYQSNEAIDAPTSLRRRLVFISLHLGKIDAFNANETRLGLAPRRMQISLAIEVRHPGSHFVRWHLCDGQRFNPLAPELISGHFRLPRLTRYDVLSETESGQ